MGIRDEAAKKLAQDILEPFVAHGLCSPLSVDMVATLIQLAVTSDEAVQATEWTEARLAETRTAQRALAS